MTESSRDALRNEPVQDWDLFERCAREVAARRVWNQASEILKIIDEEATRRLQDPDLKQQLEVGMKVTAEVQKREHDKLRQQIALAKALKQPIKVKEDYDDPTYNQHKIAPHVATYQPR